MLLDPCPPDWIHYAATDKCYNVSTTKASWPDAEAACAEMGAKLASISDKAEFEFIKSIL